MTRTGGRWVQLPVAMLILMTAACGNTTTEPTADGAASGVIPSSPTEVTVALGEEVEVAGGPLRVVFERVVEDSRCPVDVVCVWEGNAVVQVGLAAGSGPTFPVQLNSSLEPRSAEWNGVRLTFLELLPQPLSQGPAPEHVLRLRVEGA